MLCSGKLDKKWWQVTQLTPGELRVSDAIHSLSFKLIGSFVHTLLITGMKDTWERIECVCISIACMQSCYIAFYVLVEFLHLLILRVLAVLWHSWAVLPGACCLPQTPGAEGYSECLQPQEAALSICNPFTNVLLVSVRGLTALLSKLHLFLSHQAHLCMQPVWNSLLLFSWFLCLYPVEPLYCPSLKYIHISV